MIKNSKNHLKELLSMILLKQPRENVLQHIKIKVRPVLNKTLNYILPVPYR